VINAKLPRCTHDGDRGEHDYRLGLSEGRVNISCRRCGGYLCKDADPAVVEFSDAALTGVRLSYNLAMVLAD
jgi:hypothetical protein